MQLLATDSKSLRGGKETWLTVIPVCLNMLVGQTSEHCLLLNLRCTVYKLMLPEVVGGVLDELNEGDKKPPGVGSVHYQPLQQDSATRHMISTVHQRPF